MGTLADLEDDAEVSKVFRKFGMAHPTPPTLNPNLTTHQHRNEKQAAAAIAAACHNDRAQEDRAKRAGAACTMTDVTTAR
jgi:hypothetical protein